MLCLYKAKTSSVIFQLVLISATTSPLAWANADTSSTDYAIQSENDFGESA